MGFIGTHRMNTNSSIYFGICSGNEGVLGFVLDSGNTMANQKQSQSLPSGSLRTNQATGNNQISYETSIKDCSPRARI